ncbi:DNA internalization-related competence protein ComEC/Rec2 [Clostridiisalibacter paucivorans]|uniref:DNA internalization-related competence protein ComEC/Rec2 n=1 Tax=Clostridiisalibacter paucivorans TaxID=408753 RepID=UPI0004789465|nr:DNA internalization-related competence protein ComEC/Rec2 [Clostridiisalibacter paucivorans]
MRRPFINLLISLILGIYVFDNFKLDMIIMAFFTIFIFVLIFIDVYLGFKRALYVYIAMFLLGGFLVSFHTNKSKIEDYANEIVDIEGVVKEKNYIDKEYSKYIIDTDTIKVNKKIYKIDEKILLKLYGKKKFYIGEVVSVKGMVNRPRQNSNPKLFNNQLYLLTKDIHTYINARDYNVKIVSSGNNRLLAVIDKFKNHIINIFDEMLSPKYSNIMKSIILGDDRYLDESYIEKFRDFGIAHILAVSGLHIGIIAAMFMGIFRLLMININVSTVFTLGILWFYGFMIGFPPSVLRALIMFSVFMGSFTTYRRYDAINGLFFVGVLLLLINPFWLFHIGFQLSFIATLSILVFNNKLLKLLKRQSYILSIISTIISVQLGIIPIVAYHFNTISYFALITNIVIIPLISFGVSIGFIMIFISILSFKLTLILGFILNGILYILDILMYILDKLYIGDMIVVSPNHLEIFIYYFSILTVFRVVDMININFNIKRFLYIIFIVIILCYSFTTILDDKIYISFVDVGQGDCAIIRKGNTTLMIDSGGSDFGNFDIGKNITAPLMLKNGIKNLDGIFITHFDADHCKAAVTVMNSLNVDNLFIGYRNPDKKLYKDILETANNNNICITTLKDGERLFLDKSFYIDVLGPSPKIANGDYTDNNKSLVLMINAYKKRILFTGDIEKDMEYELIDKKDIKSNILKVPHHGSSTSSTKKFIKAVNPHTAIISVGKNNFGHPNNSVLNRFRAEDIKIYRTDNEGLITIILDEKGFNIETYKKEKLKLYNVIRLYGLDILILIIYIIILLRCKKWIIKTL